MAAPDSEEGFKVTDRRRRLDSPEAPSPPPAPGPRSDRPPAAPSPGEIPSPPPPGPQRTLAGLLMMLASSAMVALGEVPDPISGERQHDPGQAAEVIDLLLLLREKTEGNRTAEETELLDELIYTLQMRYVSAGRPSG